MLRGGGRTRTLATQVATAPAWRSDGGAIAFGQLVTHAIRLRIADAARHWRVRELKLALCPLGGPSWSPDGRFLAVAAPIDQRHCERGAELVVVSAKDGAIAGRQAITDPTPGPPAWSSDSRYASEGAIIGTPGLAIVPSSTRFGPARLMPTCALATWAPHGSRFAAACDGHLALVDARTGGQVDLASARLSPGRGPVWSSDGTHVAATADGGFVVAAVGGRSAVVRVGGCWAGWVFGFSGDNRALVQASVAPPGD